MTLPKTMEDRGADLHGRARLVLDLEAHDQAAALIEPGARDGERQRRGQGGREIGAASTSPATVCAVTAEREAEVVTFCQSPRPRGRAR